MEGELAGCGTQLVTNVASELGMRMCAAETSSDLTPHIRAQAAGYKPRRVTASLCALLTEFPTLLLRGYFDYYVGGYHWRLCLASQA